MNVPKIAKIGVIRNTAEVIANKAAEVSRVTIKQGILSSKPARETSAGSRIVSEKAMSDKVSQIKKVVQGLIKKAEDVTNIGSVSFKNGVYTKDGRPYTGFAKTSYSSFSDVVPAGEYYRDGKLLMSIDTSKGTEVDSMQKIILRNHETGNSAVITRINDKNASRAIYSSTTNGKTAEIESSAKPVGELFDISY